MTLGQAVLLLMALVVTAGLTQETLTDLLQVLTVLLPEDSLLPSTKYLFKKVFTNGKCIINYYCPECLGLLVNNQCSKCVKSWCQNQLKKDGKFLFSLLLIPQFKHILETLNLGEHLAYKQNRSARSTIDDIMDGKLYQKMYSETNLKDEFSFSLTINSDGVPIFRSSSFSIWPIFAFINELPPQERKKHTFLTGLWFGLQKPNMSSFLRPLSNELKKLVDVGFQWCLNGQTTVRSYVYTLVCCCDSVARAMLQNIKQFNGKYGCNWCLHPGRRVPKGRAFVQVYPYQGNVVERDMDSMIFQARRAGAGESETFGVKGPTPLMLIPYFNIVSGFIVDSMHCIDLGVMRQLAHLWFDGKHHDEPWYMGNKVKDIDERLASFTPPSNITRTPRSLSQRSYWKASEWRAFLLFYGSVVLQAFLPAAYFFHFLLLCNAVHILQQSSISQMELFYATQDLIKFVQDFEKLYGICHMTFNVHLLLHIPDTVRNWGPIWCYSAYSFESCNGLLLKLFNGTQAVPVQILSSYFTLKQIEAMNRVTFSDATEMAVNVFNNLLTGYCATKTAQQYQDSVLFGKFERRPLNLFEKYCVETALDVPVEDYAIFSHKAIINSQVYKSKTYRNASKRNDSVVKTCNGTTGQIESFVSVKTLTGEQHVVCLLRTLQTARLKSITPPAHLLAPHGAVIKHIFTVDDVGSLTAVKPTDLCGKFVVYRKHTSFIICLLPNLFERD